MSANAGSRSDNDDPRQDDATLEEEDPMAVDTDDEDDDEDDDDDDEDDILDDAMVVGYGGGGEGVASEVRAASAAGGASAASVVANAGVGNGEGADGGGIVAGSGETDAGAAAKRAAIQAIMRDKSLSDLERRRRIQALMDGTAVAGPSPLESTTVARAAAAPASSAASAAPSSAASVVAVAAASAASVGGAGLPHETISCMHYERKCNVVAPCCNRVFGCRVCHDELAPPVCNVPMDRFAVREIVCTQCDTRQPASNQCKNCGITFAEYHCSICNLWMSQQKRPFHCYDCGFCRVGGRENFRHCNRCAMCISASIYDKHHCMKDKYKNNCPVCREDMFSSRQSPQDLPCGHAIHAHCFRKLAGFDYRCPICKKTVVSQQSMAAAWEARARDIETQPMPKDLARVVNIMCNDCETKSLDRNWHFLGVQCPRCRSFNTVVEHVVACSTSSADADGAGNGDQQQGSSGGQPSPGTVS